MIIKLIHLLFIPLSAYELNYINVQWKKLYLINLGSNQSSMNFYYQLILLFLISS